MSSIFLLNDEETTEKINIDELYEKNLKRDLKQLSIFNKILGRIHKRIKHTAQNKQNDKYIWFLVPEFIFGEPTYDKGDCIAFIVNKLTENGFFVKYIHPNTLFVSWEQWVPSYVRTEIKKKTGKSINERGEIVLVPEENNDSKLFRSGTMAMGMGMQEGQYTQQLQQPPQETPEDEKSKKFTPLEKYKPSGKLLYNDDYFEKLKEKL